VTRKKQSDPLNTALGSGPNRELGSWLHLQEIGRQGRAPRLQPPPGPLLRPVDAPAATAVRISLVHDDDDIMAILTSAAVFAGRSGRLNTDRAIALCRHSRDDRLW